MSDAWIETTLGELIEIVRGVSYKSAEIGEVGEGVPFLNLKSVERGGGFRADGVKAYTGSTKSTQTIRPNDVLIAVTDLTRGKELLGCPVVVPDDPKLKDATFSLDLAKLNITSESIAPQFLTAVLQSPQAREFMKTHSSGTTVIHLKTRDVPDFKFSLPPLTVQRRIVDLLEHLDTLIANLEQEREAGAHVRAAFLVSLLSRDVLIPQTYDAAFTFAAARESPSSETKGVSDDWVETTLGEVAEASWGNTTITKASYVGRGFTAYSASGADGLVAKAEMSGPAIILSAIGALCGKSWFADGKWTAIKNTMWIRSASASVSTKFLYYWAQIPDTWPKRGQAQPFIALGDVRALPIVLPPLSVQARIVDLLESVDASLSDFDREIEGVTSLRRALLTALLSREIEIPESYVELLGVAS